MDNGQWTINNQQSAIYSPNQQITGLAQKYNISSAKRVRMRNVDLATKDSRHGAC